MANQQVAVRTTPDQFKQEIVLARPSIEKMLPEHLKFEKFEGMVVSVVSNNMKLLECSQASLMKAVIDSADVGLSLNPVMREADILPVWSPNGTVAQFRPRAIGLMKLARQGGDVIKIEAHEVCEQDEFEQDLGLNPDLRHKPPKLGTDRGPIIGAYCVWQLKDGTKQFEVIDRKRIDRSRGASEAYKYAVKNNNTNTPWIQDEAEMVRKTVVRAAAKYMPMSVENEAFRRALAADDEIEGTFEHVDTGPEEEQKPQSGATQVAALESRLGVTGGGAGSGQTQGPGGPGGGASAGEPAKGAPAASSATAPAAAASAAPTATPQSQPPSGTSQQTANPAGGATTASRSRTRNKAAQQAPQQPAGPAGPEPPAPEEGDYGVSQGQQTAQQPAAGQVAPKAGAPMQDLPGDDLGDPVDFPAEARAMRAELATISATPIMQAFLERTKPMRAQMKNGAPEWYKRIMAEIVSREELIRAQ